MNPLTTILFDLDGTLIDSLGGILQSFRATMLRFYPERTFSDEIVLQYVGRPLDAMMLELCGDAALVPDLISAYREHNRALIPDLQLFPGILQLLESLRERDLKVGIVTSKNRISTDITLTVHKLAPLLDIVLTQDDTTRHKPDPEPLTTAFAQLGVAPAETAYVGDAVFDIQCARRAGCLGVGALWGTFDTVSLTAEQPDLSLETPRDLIPALEELGRLLIPTLVH